MLQAASDKTLPLFSVKNGRPFRKDLINLLVEVPKLSRFTQAPYSVLDHGKAPRASGRIKSRTTPDLEGLPASTTYFGPSPEPI